MNAKIKFHCRRMAAALLLLSIGIIPAAFVSAAPATRPTTVPTSAPAVQPLTAKEPTVAEGYRTTSDGADKRTLQLIQTDALKLDVDLKAINSGNLGLDY